VAHPQTREVVAEDEFNGWLRASETVDVRARVRGHIAKVHFKDGDFVQAGDPLFDLDPSPFEIAKLQAEAKKKVYEAQKLAADKTVERNTKLAASAVVSQQELDESIATAASFTSQIAAAEQEIQQHKLDLEYAHIRAPISGKTSRALLTEGNLVNAGGSDPLLTTIVAVDPIYVYFNVDERSLQRYRANRKEQAANAEGTPLRDLKVPFTFGLDSDEGYPHQGTLDFADNRIDPTTGTIEVRGTVDNKDGFFIPGSRVRVRVPEPQSKNAMLVPDVAVNTDQDKKYVLVLADKDGEKNVVQRCDVTLGRLLDDGMRIVVRAEPELSPTDWIIVEGVQRARLNYPVEPIKPESPATSASTTPSSSSES
jgi:RND family efflux transporter MFP subunit